MDIENRKVYIKNLKYLFFITNPVVVIILFNMIAVALFLLVPNEFMIDFAKEEKYISYKAMIIYFIFIFSFVIGYLLTPGRKRVNISNALFSCYYEMRFFAYLTFILTIIGYFLWFKNVFLNLNYYISMLFIEGTYKTRDLLKNQMISGITTFTQFGLISSILFMLLYLLKKRKIYLVFIFLILLLASFRAILFGERLAVLEIVIPLAFIYLRFNPQKMKLFGILLMIFLFSWATELFRSYMSPVYHNKYSPIEFLFYRFEMYLVTTINNTFLIFDRFNPFLDFLPSSLKFFYNFIDHKLISDTYYKLLLENYANPEYNNKSPWGELYFDFGYFGIVMSFILGSLSKIFYFQYKKFTFLGVLVYPIFLIFLFQSYRILYINDSRVIYVWFSIFMIYFIHNYRKSIKIRKV